MYWCEGTKDKIYRRTEVVKFINSDPALVIFFLRFLAAAGVPPDDIDFRVSIHVTADIEGATRFWAELVNAPVERFRKPTIKRHNPRTTRKNLVDGYRGCLQISVRRSAELYRRIEGWAYGTMLGADAAHARLDSRSDETIRAMAARRHRLPETSAGP
ncbi:hypothetical protein [Spirillospora albida]|uniref:hypothetical protein n=1 Tax=Spirillospora albida TaxID=58123 RepID=UPI0012FB5E34|nr:hypothetical protein [Spirillospora albida]